MNNQNHVPFTSIYNTYIHIIHIDSLSIFLFQQLGLLQITGPLQAHPSNLPPGGLWQNHRIFRGSIHLYSTLASKDLWLQPPRWLLCENARRRKNNNMVKTCRNQQIQPKHTITRVTSTHAKKYSSQKFWLIGILPRIVGPGPHMGENRNLG